LQIHRIGEANADLQLEFRPALRPASCLAAILVFFALPAGSALPTLSVIQFGAKADGILRTDGAMVAGSPVLTSSSGSFTASDVGKYIQVVGAGPGGASHVDGSMTEASAVLHSPSGAFAPTDVGRGIIVLGAGASGGNLITTIAGYASPTSALLNAVAGRAVTNALYYYGAMTLEGTIEKALSPTSVQLSAAASATVAAATYAYGTNDQAAFQSAVDGVGRSGGGVVSVPQATDCPAHAVCGYVIAATDQTTASAPGAVKIRYSNVTFTGQGSSTSLFCRGAWATYSNSVKFPNQNATIRGNCLAIGDNGGPSGAAGESVSNVTISGLHLYGMTNGNTYNTSFGPTDPPLTTTGDGWDITHKAIYLWEGGAFSDIRIDSVYIQDFKGENIFSGGSAVSGMVIQNSTMTNFNGDGISVLAADLQVLNNVMSNGSNAGVEDATKGSGSGSLVRQVYSSNTISLMPREAIVIYGVDGTVPSGTVQILGNCLSTIGQINGSAAQTGILVIAQAGGDNVAPANVSITGNVCHDCRSFGVLESSGNTQVSANIFIVDGFNAYNFLSFTFPMNNFAISGNVGYVTGAGHSLDTVYALNPGYMSGNFAWNDVTVQGNVWNFPGTSNYTFYTTQGPAWNLVTSKNVIWAGDTCIGCTYPDVNHGVVNLSKSLTIEPYGPVVTVTGNTASVTATIDASKEQGGSQVRIVNTGSFPVVFASDANLSLAAPVKVLAGGSASFRYNDSIRKFVGE